MLHFLYPLLPASPLLPLPFSLLAFRILDHFSREARHRVFLFQLLFARPLCTCSWRLSEHHNARTHAHCETVKPHTHTHTPLSSTPRPSPDVRTSRFPSAFIFSPEQTSIFKDPTRPAKRMCSLKPNPLLIWSSWFKPYRMFLIFLRHECFYILKMHFRVRLSSQD